MKSILKNGFVQMVPFFVVDRPISLEIIKEVKIPQGKKIGLMTHANTSKNFQIAFHDYPSENTIKMCDSAIFHPQRDKNTYTELFEKYEGMNADYGVIIDVLRDSKATIKSAENALKIYSREKDSYSFNLVGVAQGNSLEEFINCYQALNSLGYEYIAVGGLLHKREKSARYMNVKSEFLLIKVLSEIRGQFNPKWLFVLGCLHPSRLDLFRKLDVWGDYKGWIFNYKKRNDFLKKFICKFRTNHLAHASNSFQNSQIGTDLSRTLVESDLLSAKREKLHLSLINKKKKVRELVNELYEEFSKISPNQAELLLPFAKQGLMSESSLNRIKNIINGLLLSDDYFTKLTNFCCKARKAKNKLIKIEERVENHNEEILSILSSIKENNLANQELRDYSLCITETLSASEQEFRISQVQTFIEDKILKFI